MTKELSIQNSFPPDQIELIKRQIAVGCTTDELNLFLYQCKRTGLDPLSRQIYCIKRKVWNKDKGVYDEKATIQTSIDGLRLIAERSGSYAGQDEPQFEEDEKGNPNKCVINVYRFHGDTRYVAAVGVAHWNEYAQKTREGNYIGLWAKMPHVMMSKVAESIALRKAFPQELSGLYSEEEMSQQEEPKQETPTTPPSSPPTTKKKEYKKEPGPLQVEEAAEILEGEIVDEESPSKRLVCTECDSLTSEKIADFSNSKFGRTICYKCQKHLEGMGNFRKKIKNSKPQDEREYSPEEPSGVQSPVSPQLNKDSITEPFTQSPR